MRLSLLAACVVGGVLASTCTRANPDYNPAPDADADADADSDGDSDADADADGDGDGDADADADGDGDADGDADADADSDLPCAGNERGCSADGNRSLYCVEPAFVRDRTCPDPSSCIGGRCDSAGLSGCDQDGDCAAGQVCAPLVDFAQPTQLRRYCVEPVGAFVGLQACVDHDECQTAACIGGECFQACQNGTHCPDGRECVSLVITVDGVTDSVRACD